MKVQVIILHDPNSSDPVQVIGVLSARHSEGASYEQLMKRAVRWWLADEQEQENEAAQEEGREPEIMTVERLHGRGYSIETQVLPITEGF